MVWFLSSFGVIDGKLKMADDLNDSFLVGIGSAVSWIFIPLGFGQWQSAVAAITGLVAKENILSTFGILYGFAEVAEDGAEIWSRLAAGFTVASAYAFLVFNLLCVPCFAAIGAIRREMNSAKWTFFAISYQTIFAYAVSLCIYQFSSLFTTGVFHAGTVAAFIIAAVFVYLLFRPCKTTHTLKTKVRA